MRILLDKEDSYLLRQYHWRLSSHGYAVAEVNLKSQYLHRIILNARKGQVVDHINGNKLDNRKSNLRLCTQRQNCCNSNKGSKSTSKYKGVYKHSSGMGWVAQCRSNDKTFYLGIYKSEIEAAKAYNSAAIKLHGEFARLNSL